MAKIIISSLICLIWLRSFDFVDDEYELGIKNGRLCIDNDYIEGEGKGDAYVVLTKEQFYNFIAILKHLHDQPIVLAINDNRLWLWQAML